MNERKCDQCGQVIVPDGPESKEEDYLCRGCGSYICTFHELDPWGEHRKEDHGARWD